jgi:tetratricopeptide (TPR) repeat protein
MNDVQSFSLESIRTDGWFERIGESIGSFQALCDIVGAQFFAFAMITGARITALTVDRRNPDSTLVEFVVGGEDTERLRSETQRLTLGEFRKRLVGALLAEEAPGALPERETDTEGLQRHIGVRYLLLAPLYGYSLLELTASAKGSQVRVLFDGVEEVYSLVGMRARLRAHVREELQRAQRSAGAVDLSRVAEAEVASLRGEPVRVLELLGAWPAPLAIFLRTPEGQALGPEARATIARGLGLLGSSCIKLGDVDKGEEILRLAIQYAGDGPEAADTYRRLGESAFYDGRPGESIAALRRAANLGAPAASVWPLLSAAFSARGRHLAALSAALEGIEGGVAVERFEQPLRSLAVALGEPVQAWAGLVQPQGLPRELLGLTG